ncbi:predicted protein [Uncinocarpus reesii 1704]|uniref:Uncharacterized protein n=1 Tax=Uncinocarpus reesii (strain UAMH 1704) TaxID=336963 RepID=C4JZQ6_UNCRE|nr:uncharacterized protein UREG_07657 [Uncinocarpus reesii 1704]EEP82792.1 predicted protein [Uncinocarpus reesii 1704]
MPPATRQSIREMEETHILEDELAYEVEQNNQGTKRKRAENGGTGAEAPKYKDDDDASNFSDATGSATKAPAAKRKRGGKSGASSQAANKPKPKKSINQLVQEGRNARKALKASEKRVLELEEQVNKLHQSILDIQKRYRHLRTDDQVIRDSLFKIIQECQSWAKEHSLVTAVNSDVSPALARLMGGSNAEMPCRDIENAVAVFQLLRRGPYMLLQTVLSHFICNNIIVQPFHFLEGHSANVQKMADIFNSLLPKKYKGRMNEWVGQTVSLFRADEIDGGYCYPKDSWTRLQSLRQKCYSEMVTSFLKGAQCIMKPTSNASQENTRYLRLYSIIRQTSDVALMLWEQRLPVRCLSSISPQLSEFENGSDLMKAHHAMLLSAENTTLNGNNIACVITPAIVSLRDIRTPHEYRIWSQAIVWAEGWQESQAIKTKTAKEPSIVNTDINVAKPCNSEQSGQGKPLQEEYQNQEGSAKVFCGPDPSAQVVEGPGLQTDVVGAGDPRIAASTEDMDQKILGGIEKEDLPDKVHQSQEKTDLVKGCHDITAITSPTTADSEPSQNCPSRPHASDSNGSEFPGPAPQAATLTMPNDLHPNVSPPQLNTDMLRSRESQGTMGQIVHRDDTTRNDLTGLIKSEPHEPTGHTDTPNAVAEPNRSEGGVPLLDDWSRYQN